MTLEILPVKICEDLSRSAKILLDLLRSANVFQDLLEYVKIWKDLTRSAGICQNMQRLTFCVAADAPEKEWLMTMEMFVSGEGVSE